MGKSEREVNGRRVAARLALTVGVLLGAGVPAHAQTPPADAKPSMEIYGFAMLDIGHDFKQIHPDWYDTMRVTKLPTVEDEFGRDHNTFAGVRQSRLGVKT